MLEKDSSQPRQSSGDHDSIGRVGSAVSNAVVRLYAENVGRGPTRARTSFGRDVVTVVLEESLTKAEQRLAEEGEGDVVIEMRRVFQRTMRDELILAVERHTGRRVVAFLSDHQLDPDVAVEVFVLEPEEAAGTESA